MIQIKSYNNQGFIGQTYLANLLKWEKGQSTHAFAHTVKCLHLPDPICQHTAGQTCPSR